MKKLAKKYYETDSIWKYILLKNVKSVSLS